MVPERVKIICVAALAVAACSHGVRLRPNAPAAPPRDYACITDTVRPAANYPTQAVRLIEPFGAGGGPDLVGRTISPSLSVLWGQAVRVENHPGGGSTAAPALVATSPPDGHTLLINTSAQAYSAALPKNLPYDPLKDFIPIAPLTSQPYLLVASQHAGFRTLTALIAAAKAAPGKLRFASTGVGTGTHLGALKLNLAAGIQAVHVPARQGEAVAEVIASTVAGRADYQLVPIQFALTYIRAGALVPLGVTGAERSPLLPDVPTIGEAGIAGFEFPIWYGLWAPAGTPAGVIEKLARDIRRVLATPAVRDSLATHGATPMLMTQCEFAQFVLSESRVAARLVRAARISPE